MGTNYYFYDKEPCECCGRPYEPIHIGKSSGGWCFSLHVMPEDGIHNLPDWEVRWRKKGSYIENEYGGRISINQMVDIITDCYWSNKRTWTQQEFKENHAEPGPNGLVRSTIDGHCIGHGEGTWDLKIGEFS